MGVDLHLQHQLAQSSSSISAMDKSQLSGSEALIPVVNAFLTSRILTNDKHTGVPSLTSDFHGLEAPKVLLLDYLRRIEKYAFCSRSCFIMALYYLDRAANMQDVYKLVPLNVHRLFITAMLLAVKMNEDVFYDNAHFARVGGVLTHELNRFELIMLKCLDYNLSISSEQFKQFEEKVVAEVAKSSHHSCVEAQLLLIQSGIAVPQQQQQHQHQYQHQQPGALVCELVSVSVPSTPTSSSTTPDVPTPPLMSSPTENDMKRAREESRSDLMMILGLPQHHQYPSKSFAAASASSSASYPNSMFVTQVADNSSSNLAVPDRPLFRHFGRTGTEEYQYNSMPRTRSSSNPSSHGHGHVRGHQNPNQSVRPVHYEVPCNNSNNQPPMYSYPLPTNTNAASHHGHPGQEPTQIMVPATSYFVNSMWNAHHGFVYPAYPMVAVAPQPQESGRAFS